LFEACLAFTRVTACTLALSPIRGTLSEGFSYFVTSIAAPAASGWSVSPGGTCTHWKAPPYHGAHPQRSPSAMRLHAIRLQVTRQCRGQQRLYRRRNFGRAMSAGAALVRPCSKTEGIYLRLKRTYNERRGPP